MTDRYPLPVELIDHVFTRLTISYGQPFLRQYEGVQELEVVKADWAIKLAEFGVVDAENMVRIPAVDWALDNLSDSRPPNVLDFRQLCRAYRAPSSRPALPAPPRAVPERFRNALAQLAAPLEDKRPEPVRDAYAFISKWGTKGVRLNPTQQEWLKHYRGIVTRWEADQAKEASHAAGY